MFTHPSRRRGYAAGALLGLVTAPLSVLATTSPAGAEPGQRADPVEVQIVATNDFHGRIKRNGSEAGAAVLAGAVNELRAENPLTTFAAAGDLIGASTFESFVDQDKPTIDALNEAGLEVSAVGNHEFDQGYDDLVNRVMASYDAVSNPKGGAEWKYLGANVKMKASDDAALDATWIKDEGGVQVGFIGAVTEHLPELVSPAGISEIEVTDIVEATNAAADDLVAEGADVVVMLVHEGAPTTDCGAIGALGAGTDFGSIVKGVNDNVDAIVSGHTHLAYNCSFPVAGWSSRPVTERPVVSAGQYGMNLNQLVFSVDPDSGQVQAKTQEILALIGADPDGSGPESGPENYPADPATQEIVTAAVAKAEVLGAEPLGEIDDEFYRAKFADAATENRGGESTLGNLVAEIQRSATEDETFGSAQVAFMNPGGLRADLVGVEGDFPRTVTYKQAANVQPFANTLVNEDLTGAQIKTALEQQWQPEGASRPFLKLGISDGFTYTYDPDAAQDERITAMFLNGEPVDLDATYSVTVNSFLASGGDNFAALNGDARKQDTGRTDLQAQVDYFAEFAFDEPLPVDYSQRAVGVALAEGPFAAGEDVSLDLSSLSMTGPGDVTDTSVTVTLDGDSLGSFPVTTTPQVGAPGFDETGTATIDITLPDDATPGAYEFVVTGDTTGTEVVIPFAVALPSSVSAFAIPGKVVVRTSSGISVSVMAEGATATGTVEVRDGDTVLNTRSLSNGTVLIPTGRFARTGIYSLDVVYLGDGTVAPGTDTVSVKVVKQRPNLLLRAPKKVTRGDRARVKAVLKGINAEVTGKVRFRYAGNSVTRKLTNGSTSVKLAKLKKNTTVKVIYLGDGDLFTRVVRKTTIKVARR